MINKPTRIIIDIENDTVIEREWTDEEIASHAELVANTVIPVLDAP